MGITYDQDIIAWANQQATFLREGRFDLLDLEHIAEEIEDVGKSEQRELETRMAILLMHLLKWQYQPSHRGESWKRTIKEQRNMIIRRIKKTPSLKSSLSDEDWIANALADATLSASKETGIDLTKFPESFDTYWSMTDVLTENWLPSD